MPANRKSNPAAKAVKKQPAAKAQSKQAPRPDVEQQIRLLRERSWTLARDIRALALKIGFDPVKGCKTDHARCVVDAYLDARDSATSLTKAIVAWRDRLNPNRPYLVTDHNL